MTKPPVDTFWIGDEPIKYTVRRTEGTIERGAGVTIVRCEGSDEDCQQALLEIRHDGDTLRLVQVDGDLDARKVIAADQHSASFGGRTRPPLNIWRRVWKVATG
jgi:hypothetical protein